ncbi:undecaprenyl-phosphate glucose phosphotransferase [Anaerolineales bacterium]
MDALAIIVAFFFSYEVRRIFLVQVDDLVPLTDYIPTIALHIFVVWILFYFSRLYHMGRTVSRIDQGRTIIGVLTLAILIANSLHELIFRNTIFDTGYPRSMFFIVWGLSVILVIIEREIVRFIQMNLRSRGLMNDNLLIIGEGRIARDLIRQVKRNPSMGYNLVGVINEKIQGRKKKMLGTYIIGTYSDIPGLIDNYGINQVIIALPDANRSELVELINMCQRGSVDIKIYPDIFAHIAGDLIVDDMHGTPLLTVRDIALRGWRLSLKRSLDVLGSGFGLVFLSPFMLLTAFIIRYESPGPIFYSQVRMGLDGRPFPIIKFRSMSKDAERTGEGWTVKDDPRVTRFGSFMRKTNWDEIPQLINVFLGHMSLVGPRPERPVYVHQFRENIPRYMERHREKAGMTGWAQVNGLRGDTSIPLRTQYDLWYVENWSLWLDLKIIIRTIWQTVTRSSPNAY